MGIRIYMGIRMTHVSLPHHPPFVCASVHHELAAPVAGVERAEPNVCQRRRLGRWHTNGLEGFEGRWRVSGTEVGAGPLLLPLFTLFLPRFAPSGGVPLYASSLRYASTPEFV
jgi:hypothetical protein